MLARVPVDNTLLHFLVCLAETDSGLSDFGDWLVTVLIGQNSETRLQECKECLIRLIDRGAFLTRTCR